MGSLSTSGNVMPMINLRLTTVSSCSNKTDLRYLTTWFQSRLHVLRNKKFDLVTAPHSCDKGDASFYENILVSGDWRSKYQRKYNFPVARLFIKNDR
jgi:hypothetical protein